MSFEFVNGFSALPQPVRTATLLSAPTRRPHGARPLPSLGTRPDATGTLFSVWSQHAERIELCLFDAGGTETARLPMHRGEGDVFSLHVAGIGAGARYGFRADGPYDPARGLWFDPAKLLVDPYALAIDRPYRHDPALAAPRGAGVDTAHLVPKAIVGAAQPESQEPPAPPRFRSGGFVYELSVRAFTMRHPDVPAAERGTLRGLAHPSVIVHLKRLGVDAVELMPVTAWIDERHLPPLGLSNAWGYNPVTFMALDPRLAPGGVADLRHAVEALHAAGIGVLLDLVFNHTGESDALGATLSLRGLDNLAYYRHAPDDPGLLVNDTGCGNTLRCDHPIVRAMILDTLRHFVRAAGVDGFRFDLAPVLGRTDAGFDPDAALLREIAADPLLSDRVLIAEPWDIGADGYRLGAFPPPFLEWNDRARDDMRRFWKSDPGTLGALATRLAGSSDFFSRGGRATTRTVNFIAAHDGMTLADMVAYRDRHNLANGEDNRDGHGENHSWNNGVEGPSDDPAILAHRRRDVRALLATLFASRGTIMLTAGDEFGRSQHGNNNSYAQDNDITWLDWTGRDRDLEAFVAALSALRRRFPALADTAFLTGAPLPGSVDPDVAWLAETGHALAEADWNDPHRHRLVMVLASPDAPRVAVAVNGDRRATVFSLPLAAGRGWRTAIASDSEPRDLGEGRWHLPGRSVAFFEEFTEVTQ
jgi:glycogen operon protein